MGEPGCAVRDCPDRNDDAGREIFDSAALVPHRKCVDAGRALVDAALLVLYIVERLASDHGGQHFNSGHGPLGRRPVAPILRILVVRSGRLGCANLAESAALRIGWAAIALGRMDLGIKHGPGTIQQGIFGRRGADIRGQFGTEASSSMSGFGGTSISSITGSTPMIFLPLSLYKNIPGCHDNNRG